MNQNHPLLPQRDRDIEGAGIRGVGPNQEDQQMCNYATMKKVACFIVFIFGLGGALYWLL